METNLAVSALAALAHPVRLSVVRLLVKAGSDGLTAGDLSDRLGVLPNTLSANLKALSYAGLVSSQREGRSIRYHASYDCLKHLINFMIEDCCCGVDEIKAPLCEMANAGAGR